MDEGLKNLGNDRENRDGSKVRWLACHCAPGTGVTFTCMFPFCGDFPTSLALVVQLNYAGRYGLGNHA